MEDQKRCDCGCATTGMDELFAGFKTEANRMSMDALVDWYVDEYKKWCGMPIIVASEIERRVKWYGYNLTEFREKVIVRINELNKEKRRYDK